MSEKYMSVVEVGDEDRCTRCLQLISYELQDLSINFAIVASQVQFQLNKDTGGKP